MRQPWLRRSSPNATSGRSCCSPSTQASSARGPSPRSQPRERATSRPRTRLLAKCSCATETSPRCQRSPRSRRYGNRASSSTTSTVNAARRRSKAACAPASSNESSAAARAAEASAIAVPESPTPSATIEPRRLCRRESPVQVRAHPQDTVDVLVAVEAEPATRSLRGEEGVAALPGAQQLDRHADATGQLADAEKLF